MSQTEEKTATKQEEVSEETSSPGRRIIQMELALEQCQNYIDELKAQLTQQHFLQEQLASTEEYSHIQQKAIVALRDQLIQRPQIDDLEVLRDQREALSAQVDQQLESLSDFQTRCDQLDAEVTRLVAVNHKLEADLQLALDTDVESTQLRIIAQQTSERLRAEIRSLEEQIQTLEDRLRKGEGNQQKLRTIIHALQHAQESDSQKNLAIRDLSASLLTAQDKIISLENEVVSQSLMQAQLQQASFELEETIKDKLKRIDEQEQQIAEMQEQIIHQAQESREFDTAVQHWKDRSKKYERFLGQLFYILDALPEHSEQLKREQYDKLIQLRAEGL
ncbi:MAG: hypothetical protein AAGB01_06865 [Cyanobacteria bacterium P01_F01_bin.42]